MGSCVAALRSPIHILLVCLAAWSTPACKGCQDSAANTAAPQGIEIPVIIDGREGSPINGALLQNVPPDFTDQDRRAWRLRSLLGAVADRPHTVIEIEDETGHKTTVLPEGEQGRQAVLAVNRTGEVRVAWVKPDEPFPPFHGRGGNRGRGGDPTRIREVRKIWIRVGE